jgi:hypothetical protein
MGSARRHRSTKASDAPQASLRGQPEHAIRVLEHRLDLVAGQSVLGRQPPPSFSLSDCGALELGAEPQPAGLILKQRADLCSLQPLDFLWRRKPALLKPVRAAR